METILVVDDDKDIRELLMILLQSEGYNVVEAENGEEALKKIDINTSLVILDIMMPKLNGIQTCTKIREVNFVPILFLTAKGQDSDKIIGFSAGGDDYLVKPFSPSELMARVKALLRRHLVYTNNMSVKEDKVNNIIIRDLIINLDEKSITLGNKQISLTPREFDILVLLASTKNKVFSAQNIYESVWNEPYFSISNNTIMVHIRKLREKIEQKPQSPEYIKTVWGMEYKIE
ncbi:DNA-binding response regulator [Candidatus Epulonipiscium fishelsonii]|uniref:DNA-binding response regulator n=1 Tax=Candidatus Epulonipiscium fishelsonii TaxID=77094 RepID=A0ACC8X8Y7_9FIRM|nr:DNA-binding response regulator [Epulopiscium sp. SCG-B11WGA-EpuloA1]ONI38951.1 DNA-binding response regulator [Epulopiscium sp. SCG-B05WGA-EpuloA1]